MNSAAKTLLCTLQGCPVYQYAGGRGEFIADADIDADGAPHAYHPDDTGLDALANAKDRAGRFVGILTDSHGRPIVQASGDPAPGYYISTTTYEDTDQPEATQRRYVDAERVPFIVVSPRIRRSGLVGGLGGFAFRVVAGQPRFWSYLNSAFLRHTTRRTAEVVGRKILPGPVAQFAARVFYGRR